MNVLIAIDASKASQCVLEEAAARPWPAGTTFSIIHVVDPYYFTRLPAILELARQEGTSLVRHAVNKLSRAGLKANSEVLLGSPRTEIADYAKRLKADLLMVGSHGLGAVARFLLGSVAASVLRAGSCSVEIVRAGVTGSPASSHALKILLATDGSHFSKAAAKSIVERPWPEGSQVRIVSVAELPIFENPMASTSLSAIYPVTLMEELLESAKTQAEDADDSARKILLGGSLRVVDHKPTPIGDPRLFLLDLAKEWAADLVVLGSHGRRGIDRLVMGSVSESVAIHAHCSVEVIRA